MFALGNCAPEWASRRSDFQHLTAWRSVNAPRDHCGFRRDTLTPMSNRPKPFGVEDASFLAAGGEAGIRRLVERFYYWMETLPEGERIRNMHPADIEISIDKLARFLCGWLGGPKRYQEKFGPIALPKAHRHLPIDAPDRDAWLLCMERALEEQPFTDEFKRYLREQLGVPAERIRRVCSGEPARQ